MKRLLTLCAILIIAAVPAMAQPNYHYQENMNCSDCHSAHASAHTNLTGGAPITTPNTTVTTPNNTINPYYPAPNPGPGRSSLLKADDVCETCHKDQTFAPDVYGDNLNGYVRSAGGVREDSTGGGHKIGTTVAAPGYKSDVINYFPAGSELECVSCHSPHGGTAFRNLVPYGMSGAPGYSAAAIKPTLTKAAAFNPATDVTILNGNTYTFGSGNLQAYYGRQAVVYAKAATPLAAYNGAQASNRLDNFCGVCHGNFHGGDKTNPDNVSQGGGATSAFLRHPTGLVSISPSNANAFKQLKVYQVASVQAAGDAPGCVSCHKAHGNNNPFALIYPSNKATADTKEEGDGNAYRNLCNACHGMGGGVY